MISKKLKKLIAVMVCLGFITLTFSGVALAVDKKVQTPDMKTFLKKPMHLLNSLLLNAFLGPNPKARGGTIEKSNSSSKIIKITGNLKSDKVSDDD